MKAAISSRRTRIAEDAQPSAKDKTFAESLGVDCEMVWPEYVDYHLGHGSLMADWAAAWRAWTRNQVRFGRATGQRNLPLLSVAAAHDPTDAYGATAWAARLPDTTLDTMTDGSRVPCLGGYAAAETARDVMHAIGEPPTWRGDLSPIAVWLRDGMDPDTIVGALRSAPPSKPLAYYTARVRERGLRRAG